MIIYPINGLKRQLIRVLVDLVRKLKKICLIANESSIGPTSTMQCVISPNEMLPQAETRIQRNETEMRWKQGGNQWMYIDLLPILATRRHKSCRLF